MTLDSDIRVRLTSAQRQRLEAQAEARGVKFSEHVRQLLNGQRPADMLSFASGGRYSPGFIGYAMATAEVVIDSPEWGGVDSADWLIALDQLLGFLRENPYCPEGKEKVLATFAAMPAEVRERMQREVAVL